MAEKLISPEITRLTGLLNENPRSRLFVPLAEAYRLSGMVDEAISVLSNGIEVHETFVAARLMLGKIYLEKEALPEAKMQFEHVVAISPSNILSLKGLAKVLEKEGLIQEAKEPYESILQIDPTDKDAGEFLEGLDEKTESPFENTGEVTTAILSPEGDETEGLTLGGVVKDDPKIEIPLRKTNAGNSIPKEDLYMGKQGETLPLVEIAPALKEKEPHLTQTLATLYLSQGHYKEAVDVYEKLLMKDPSNRTFRQGLDEALQHIRGKDKPEKGTGLSSVAKRIRRLQLWLDAIQKKRHL